MTPESAERPPSQGCPGFPPAPESGVRRRPAHQQEFGVHLVPRGLQAHGLRAEAAGEVQETAERPAPSDTAGGQSQVQELDVHLVPRGLQAHGLRAEAAGEVQESAECGFR